jgi:hypothetical protein
MAVVIPAHNEAASIAAVVADVRRCAPQAEIVVIDDGSSDETSAVARRCGAAVLSLPYNLGIGGAIQTGYRYAIGRCDVVVRVDGDGQHDARYIEQLVAPLRAGEADVVIGSRFAGGGAYASSLPRALGIRFFSALVGLATRQRFSDTTSGFHACTRDAAAFLVAAMPPDYPEIEGLILLCRAGFRVSESAVVMRPRQGGRSSIGPIQAVYYVFKVTIAVLIGVLRRQPAKETHGSG